MRENQFIFPENEQFYKQILERKQLLKFDPQKFFPWWLRPCRVNVLVLADGGLNFGLNDFGLSTFISILKNDGRQNVQFNITIAHRSAFVADPGVPVSRSIPNFRFTTADHFSEDMYDQVWLFGIDASAGSLSNAELTAVSNFMNKGGGIFATGDHGELGRGLCGSITRVRSMRRWNNSNGEVGMSDPRRNDTNRIGHDAGSQFDDQSDDVPQTITPKLYSSRVGAFWQETYPHPLLCSPLGRITVLPDHPHEGECIAPADITQVYLDGTPEYPMGVRPEVIAWSNVPAGNTSGGKQATQSHNFGAICAYDGHKANVGRVVTDATWHHFVNINLIGDSSVPDTEIKGLGFLASVQGQAHFTQIKHYYVNIAVWISRPSNIACFNTRLIWDLYYNHRVMEATMDNPDIPIDKISPSLLYMIGTHATDVLGKRASQCRRLRFLLDIIRGPLPELAKLLDPWWEPVEKPDLDPPLPWIDFNPLLKMALGGVLIDIRSKLGVPDKFDPDQAEKILLGSFQSGAREGLDKGMKSYYAALEKFSKLG